MSGRVLRKVETRCVLSLCGELGWDQWEKLMVVDIWRTGEATIEKDVRERARKENERLLRLRFVFSVAAAQPT